MKDKQEYKQVTYHFFVGVGGFYQEERVTFEVPANATEREEDDIAAEVYDSWVSENAELTFEKIS